ncbi:lipopolysaccharide biosynthesis protein [Rufibacter sediminis]|uniref:Lipopolysaccharide biosynthesis protein n=1 Tax=Rufibacter sediminis TaxID=2762756 RepID=A0ABR6VNQ8_9BACT|nr:lipopolysaccharide biosynthesis protein [Rufibacter sediminis]MBC3538797.1 lipopolysaccharide biosynthesis protein [Rufibacter sediminis]
MRETNIKDKAALGFAWLTGERLGNLLSDFLISVLLARLLGPTDFGLIAMVSVFIALLRPFTEAGLGSALLRKKDATHHDYATVFWSNLALSVGTYIVLYVSAPWVFRFYSEPSLTQLIRVLGSVLILTALGMVQNIKLTKEMDFRRISLLSLASNIFSGIVGLYMAYLGWGYWALVVRQLLNGIGTTVLYWLWGTWSPTFTFSKASFRDFFGFGSKLLLANLLDTGFKNIYPLLIGKFYSAASLGYYNRASSLKDIPQALITQISGRVTYPILIEVQEDREKLTGIYRRLVQVISFLYFPVMMGLMGLSKCVVLVLLSEKWAQTTPLLQGLAFAGLLYPIHSLNLNVLTLKKRSDIFLYLEIIKKALTVLVVLITFRWGLMAMIYGQIVLSFLSLFINAHYTGKFIGYGFYEQVKDLVPNFIPAFLMGALLMGGIEALDTYTWWSLTFWLILGACLYLGLTAAFNRKGLLYLYDFSLQKYKTVKAQF